MPNKAPVVLIFEQHCFSSASQVAEKLVDENWCSTVGFELPRTWELAELKKHYQNKKLSAGFIDDAKASYALERALLLPNSEYKIKNILAIRSYFSATARLKLINQIEQTGASIHTLDLTPEEKEQISGHIKADSNENLLLKKIIESKGRNTQIVDSIATVEKPLVCILGVQHANEVMSMLRSKNIPYIPCFVWDTWVSQDIKDQLNSVYSPEKRRVDGVLEFPSVLTAVAKLRALLLPFTLISSQRLAEPTHLTNQLSNFTGLSFFAIRDESFRVSAIAEIENEAEEEKAKSLQTKLDQGSFFKLNNKLNFGLPSINVMESNELPIKISKLTI